MTNKLRARQQKANGLNVACYLRSHDYMTDNPQLKVSGY